MTISIIIPLYNGSRYISQTIESIICQTYTDWEIVVVNDGSTDNSLDIINKIAEKIPDKITILTIPNSGISTARNIGVSSSKGQYIAFIDQDDIWIASKLEKQVKFMEASKAELTFTNVIIIDDKGISTSNISVLELNKYDNSGTNTFKTLLFNNFIPISSIMIRRSLFNYIGGFDPKYKYAEDFDLVLRSSLIAYIDYIDEPLLLYREHNQSFTYQKTIEIVKETIGIVNERKSILSNKYYTNYLKFIIKQKFLLIKSRFKRHH